MYIHNRIAGTCDMASAHRTLSSAVCSDRKLVILSVGQKAGAAPVAGAKESELPSAFPYCYCYSTLPLLELWVERTLESPFLPY